MAYSRSVASALLGEPVLTNDDATYYHAFRRQDVVFGPTRYCRFSTGGATFFGKIHSCWKDHATKTAMAEVQPFVYAGADARDVGEDYPELKMVVGGTVEIAIKKIKPVDVRLLHVPIDVENLADYVESNIGTGEYSDDEDDDGFIVKGDAWGWYQYTDDGRAAPPPQFVDKVMAYETTDPWFLHEACDHIVHTYMPELVDGVTDLEILERFTELDEGRVPRGMDKSKAARITDFMHELHAELHQPKINIYTMYTLCESYADSS